MKRKPNDHLPIIAIGACRIVAAAAPEEGKPDKLPRVEIDAYNGGVMNVGYWGPVVIDLAGLIAQEETPILIGHENKFMSVFGQTDSVVNDGKTLSISGDVMGESEDAKEAVRLGKRGFKIKASVGVDPMSYGEVEAGAEKEVNGQMLTGPFTLIDSGKLNEVSIVPLGADGSTSARIAAENNGAGAPPEKGANMKLDKNGKPIEGEAIDGQPTAETIRAAAVIEQNRIVKIREITKDAPEVQAKAIADGWSPERAEVETVKAENAKLTAAIEAAKVRDKRPEPPHILGTVAKDCTTDILAAAVAIRAGHKSPEKAFGAEVCTKAADLRINSLTDLVRASLAMSGKPLNYSRHETRDFLQAAFSTRDISNIISATANKFILEGYGTVEDTWRSISAIRPVVDFKANTGARLVMSNLLQAIGPGGEIQHGALSDETATVQADTKALMLGIPRKDWINDDLSVLTDGPRRLGYAAARTFNTDFWAVFAAALAAGFSTGATRLNQTTGALTTTTLAAAEALYLALTDADGNPIGGELTTLLCGTTAFTAAREIYASAQYVGGSSKTASANIYANRFAPAFSRYLAAAPWYIVSNPMGMPLMHVAFLNGREEPFVETADADFNTLGMQMRVYYDYGSSFGEWRAAVRSTGV